MDEQNKKFGKETTTIKKSNKQNPTVKEYNNGNVSIVSKVDSFMQKKASLQKLWDTWKETISYYRICTLSLPH